MNILKNKCKQHIDLCVPKGVSLSIQNKLTSIFYLLFFKINFVKYKAELRDKLCSFLTCSRLDEPPDYMV